MNKSVQTGVYVCMHLKSYKLCDVQMRLLATASTEPIISAHFPLNASLCIEQLQTKYFHYRKYKYKFMLLAFLPIN